MHTILTSTRIRVVFVALMVALAAGLLAGCTPQNASQENQAKNRQYMSSVNTIMETFNSGMDDFATAVKDGEVLSLTAQLSVVSTAVDSLKALDVPQDMTDIQASYVKGAEELQTALTKYVELYQDVKVPQNGSFDYATYNDRLAEIQKHYSDGVAALQDADTKATEA